MPGVDELLDSPYWQQWSARMAQMLADQKARMRVRSMTPFMFETFEYMGLRCGIGGTCQSGCGYVQLPPRLRGLWHWFDELPYEELDAHGGVTYGVDRDHWIGFDTAHAGDYWPTNALAYILDEEERQELIEIRSIADTGPRLYHDRLWNVHLLRSATMLLAESVFALDYPRALPPAPRRLQLTT